MYLPTLCLYSSYLLAQGNCRDNWGQHCSALRVPNKYSC